MPSAASDPNASTLSRMPTARNVPELARDAEELSPPGSGAVSRSTSTRHPAAVEPTTAPAARRSRRPRTRRRPARRPAATAMSRPGRRRRPRSRHRVPARGDAHGVAGRVGRRCHPTASGLPSGWIATALSWPSPSAARPTSATVVSLDERPRLAVVEHGPPHRLHGTVGRDGDVLQDGRAPTTGEATTSKPCRRTARSAAGSSRRPGACRRPTRCRRRGRARRGTRPRAPGSIGVRPTPGVPATQPATGRSLRNAPTAQVRPPSSRVLELDGPARAWIDRDTCQPRRSPRLTKGGRRRRRSGPQRRPRDRVGRSPRAKDRRSRPQGGRIAAVQGRATRSSPRRRPARPQRRRRRPRRRPAEMSIAWQRGYPATGSLSPHAEVRILMPVRSPSSSSWRAPARLGRAVAALVDPRGGGDRLHAGARPRPPPQPRRPGSPTLQPWQEDPTKFTEGYSDKTFTLDPNRQPASRPTDPPIARAPARQRADQARHLRDQGEPHLRPLLREVPRR